MFQFGMPASYFSPINFDMTNGSTWSSMNLHANQNWADLSARQNLYQVPMYNFGGFSQYPSTSGMNSYLCDPMWTIGQMQASSLASGGQGIFPGMQFPWANGTTTTSSAKTDAEKEEEARMKDEYNALKELLNTYKIVNKNIKSSIRTKIETAMKKSGKIEERLAALQEAYKAIPESSIRKTIAVMDRSANYRGALEAAGYKFGTSEYSFKSGTEKDINLNITKLENEIDKVGAKDSAPTTFVTILENNEILRLISYWNDKHASDNIIDSVISKLPSGTDDKRLAFNNYVQPLVEALLNKAAEVGSSDCFDEDTISNLNDLTEDLRDAKDDGIKGLNQLKESFEKLYVMLRQMEALRINSEIQAKYSFLNDIATDDKDIINDKIIIEDTIADLQAEGLGDVSSALADDIKVAEVDGSDEDEGVTSENVEKQFQKLIDKDILKETSITYEGAKVYMETRKTGNRNHERVFILQDGEVKEIENAKIVDDKLCYIDANNKTMTLKSTDVNSIKTANKDAAKAEEKIENEKKSYDTGYEDGKILWDAIDGVTSSGEDDEVNRILNNLDKDNILGVVSGAVAACDDTEMLIEKLTEGSDASPEQIVNLLSMTLNKANELGLTETNEYKEFEKLYKAVAEEGKALDDTYEWDWSNVFSAEPTRKLYSEAIDRALEKLVIKMNEKAGHNDYEVEEKGQCGLVGVVLSSVWEPIEAGGKFLWDTGCNVVKGVWNAGCNLVEGAWNGVKKIGKGIGKIFGF